MKNVNEHLKVLNKEQLKECLKKHVNRINLYEILIAISMSIYDICDDMSYIDKENVVFAFLAYMLFAMTKIKIIEKLIGHIVQKYIIKNQLGNSDEQFEWKYKTLRKE
jgi:hypothetical protein